ncbi:MAG: SEL1-like repeat protein [Gammaproteobacteria bacterium]|nr:SEL1-like repeat protein [Gammaproteobacteria bacterium]
MTDKEFEVVKKFNKRKEHTALETEKYVEYLVSLANDKQDGEACYQLGLLYDEGGVFNPDFKTAERLYIESEKKGYTSALYELGLLYYYKKIKGKGFSDAYKCFSKHAMSTARDRIKSFTKLSDMYRKGEFVKKDPKFAYSLIDDYYENENEEAGLFEPHHLEKILLRMALLETELENNFKKIYRFASISKKILDEDKSKRNEGDLSLIKNLLSYSSSVLTGDKQIDNIIAIKSLENPNDFISFLNDFDGNFDISGIYNSSNNQVLLKFSYYNKFACFPEFDYTTRVRDIDVVIEHAHSSYDGSFEYFRQNKITNYQIDDNNNLIVNMGDSKHTITINKDSSFYIGRIRYRDKKGLVKSFVNELYNEEEFFLYKKDAIYRFDIVDIYKDSSLIPTSDRSFHDFDLSYIYQDLGLTEDLINDLKIVFEYGKDFGDDLALRLNNYLGPNYSIKYVGKPNFDDEDEDEIDEEDDFIKA